MNPGIPNWIWQTAHYTRFPFPTEANPQMSLVVPSRVSPLYLRVFCHLFQDVAALHDFADGIDGAHDTRVVLIDPGREARPDVDVVPGDVGGLSVVEIVAADLDRTGGGLGVAEDAVQDLLHRRRLGAQAGRVLYRQAD